jgi:hypothetical protein
MGHSESWVQAHQAPATTSAEAATAIRRKMRFDRDVRDRARREERLEALARKRGEGRRAHRKA